MGFLAAIILVGAIVFGLGYILMRGVLDYATRQKK